MSNYASTFLQPTVKPSSSQKASTIPNPPPTLSSSAAALSALTPILNAFNHRHRNQHHSSHWWSVFRILRRTIRALEVDIIAPTASRRTHRDNTAAASLPRARWLDTHLIPRAYEAFTQLAADNQHAPLGLMLLAVLARIHAVLSDILPDRHTDDLPQHPKRKSHMSRNQSVPTDTEETVCIDRGITISRNDVFPTKQSPPPPNPEPLSMKPDLDEPPSRRNQDKKQERAKDKKEKKTKKKKKNGDELASLFSSLS